MTGCVGGGLQSKWVSLVHSLTDDQSVVGYNLFYYYQWTSPVLLIIIMYRLIIIGMGHDQKVNQSGPLIGVFF